MAPQASGNGDSKFLAAMVKYWPILAALALALSSYYSLQAQVSLNNDHIIQLQNNTVNRDQLQNVRDSLDRIEKNQDVLNQKLDEMKAQQRRAR